MIHMVHVHAHARAQGGTEKLSEEAVEGMLEKLVKLLAYVSDKDLFAEFYRKKLARRLLHEKSSSEHYERTMLAQLKQQCGASFTQKVRVLRVCQHTLLRCNPGACF